VVEVETVASFSGNDVVLDIRSIDEQDDKPLALTGAFTFLKPCSCRYNACNRLITPRSQYSNQVLL
jgi:hypothetical protein